jgi:hypothetical protein
MIMRSDIMNKINNVEDLEREYPELVKQIKSEAYVEALKVVSDKEKDFVRSEAAKKIAKNFR